MKNIFIGLIISLILFGCASANKTPSVSGLKDQALATDFKDDGIKIFYTITGKLEKIEVYGQAEAWKGNVETLAEADALAKLVKFVHGNNVTTQRKIRILGKAIEKAQDENVNKSLNRDGLLLTTDTELESEIRADALGTESNSSANRSAKLVNETITETVTNMSAKGRLVSVRKVKDSLANKGKTYIAVYEWSEKGQAVSDTIRLRMEGRE